MRSKQVFRFDNFVLDAAKGTLFSGRTPIALRPQSMAVLIALIEQDRQVVSSKELIDSFGDSSRVNSNSLAQCIADIRRALGDTEQRLVRTVSRRGYMLAAPVIKEDAAAGPAPASPASARQAALAASIGQRLLASHAVRRYLSWTLAGLLIAATGGWLLNRAWQPAAATPLTMMANPTVAVLPFAASREDVDPKRVLAFAEEISTEILRVPRGFDLTVKQGSGNFDERSGQIARRLGVRYLVRGTATADADLVRVNVQLLEGASERQLWAQAFDIRTSEAVKQSQIAAQIARQIVVHIRSTEVKRPLPDRPEAGHFAMQGRAVLEGERGAAATARANALFRQALSLDADCIPALQGFARTKIDLAQNGWISSEERAPALAEAAAAIEHLVQIDPRNTAAHLLRGVLLRIRGDHEQAIASQERALALNSNYSLSHAELGYAKIGAGRANETERHIRDAIRLSPTDPNIWAWYFWAGYAALHTGDYPAAREWLIKGRQANPSYVYTSRWLAVAYQATGEPEKARELMKDCMEREPNFSIASWLQYNPPGNQMVAKQRARLAELLRALSVPEH